jgi:hypothetical protein
MRIKMTRGPEGMFLIEGAVDEAWQPTRRHHLEVGVIEVPKQITKGQGAVSPVSPTGAAVLTGHGPPPPDLTAAAGTEYVDLDTGDVYEIGG